MTISFDWDLMVLKVPNDYSLDFTWLLAFFRPNTLQNMNKISLLVSTSGGLKNVILKIMKTILDTRKLLKT